MSQRCEAFEEKVVELVGPGGLSESERAWILAHAAGCRPCAALLADSERALEILRRSAPVGPSAAAEQKLRDAARAALAAERRARAVWGWSRGLAVAASLVLVAGLGWYLLERGPTPQPPERAISRPTRPPAAPETPELIGRGQAPPLHSRPASGPAPTAALHDEIKSEPQDPQAKSKEPAPLPNESMPAPKIPVQDTAESWPRAPAFAQAPPRSELAAPKPAPLPPCEEGLAGDACAPASDRSSELAEALAPAPEALSSAEARMGSSAAGAAAPAPALPQRSAQVAESSRFAVRADRVAARLCEDLELRAQRLERGAPERAPLLLAAADCRRTESPERSVELYLEAAALDPGLGATVRERLSELLESSRLSPSAEDRVRRWLNSH